jgi:hypothetical protein
MRRTKTIELDGAKFTIGALSLGQVEEFLLKQREALGVDEKGQAKDGVSPDPEKLAASWREFICTGLNNGNGATNGDAMTPEKLKAELDLISFERLRSELLDFSGLKGSGEKSPGEAPAAS